MKKNLQKKGGIKDVLVVALPMLLSMSFDTIMTFADRLFLSRVGSEYERGLKWWDYSNDDPYLFYRNDQLCHRSCSSEPRAERVDNCAKVLTQAGIIACVSAPMLLLIKPLAYQLWSFGEIDPIQAEAQKFTLTY